MILLVIENASFRHALWLTPKFGFQSLRSLNGAYIHDSKVCSNETSRYLCGSFEFQIKMMILLARLHIPKLRFSSSRLLQSVQFVSYKISGALLYCKLL